jgi:hypothetical protein
MSNSLVRGLVVLSTLASSRAAFAQCATWDQAVGAQGVHGEVFALQSFNDGTGAALYVGGAFDTAGGFAANNIAKWNGTSWSALGSGFDNTVNAIQVFDDGSGPALYAGGEFSSAGGVSASAIARWNGASWSSVGGGITGFAHFVRALAVFDDGTGAALYAGGLFFLAGGNRASCIAKWDGTNWSALGAGLQGGQVFALRVFDDGSGSALYAAGSFEVVGGASANNIAKWNGTSWSALGAGLGDSASTVYALEVFDDGSGPALHAGGSFTTAGGTSVHNIAKWNGASWSDVGGGTDRFVTALQAFDDGSGGALYAGGSFGAIGGTNASRIAKWDGANWSPLGSGVLHHWVTALTVFDDGTDADADLFVGGAFSTAGGAPANNIAKWQGCGTTSFCFGDGSVVACPCANNGSPGHGCDNSAHTSGALLSVSGAASLASDTVLFDASGEKPNALSVLTQGQTQVNAVPFGQGLRCVSGHLVRMYVEHATNGAFSAPTGSEPKVHARSAAAGDTIASGSSRYYFAYYRDPTVLGGCPSTSTFNSTQSLRLIWSP